MEVKGTAVAATPAFVKDEFGDQGLERWIQGLTPEAQTIYGEGGIATSSWYPLDEALIQPMQVMVELFFPNNTEDGLRRLGRSSADYGLKKIYRAFLKLGPPHILVQRAGLIFGTYYRPGKGVLVEKGQGSATTRYLDFPEKTGFVELRIAGWVERGLEIAGARNPRVVITKSVSRGDDFIEMKSSWE